MSKVEILRERISKAFAGSCGSSVAADIAFHMTDWDKDLEELNRLYDRPEEFTDDEIVAILLSFLAHVPNHLAAAKKLVGYGPMEDIFEVGILDEDQE